MRRSASVEEQLLLHDPSLARLDVLVTAYTAYHAVKRGHPADVTSARDSGDYLDVIALTQRIATAHATKFGLGLYQQPAAIIDALPPAQRCPVMEPSTVALRVLPACLPDPRGDEPAPVTPKLVCFPATPEWRRGRATMNV